MKTKTLTYKDYFGSVDFDLEDLVIHGKILFINDLITYEADTLDGLKIEFEAAVDDYLETCDLLGREPQKAFKGSFNIRVGESLHREAAIEASKQGHNLNDFCKVAISEKLVRLKKDSIPITPKIEVSIVRTDIIQDQPSDSNKLATAPQLVENSEFEFHTSDWSKQIN